MTNIPPELEKAHKIFKEELQKHLVFFKETLTPPISSTNFALEEKKETYAELTRRFHLIKGGAGFFKIDELGKLAEEGERYYKETPRWEEAQAKLQAIINKLKQFL